MNIPPAILAMIANVVITGMFAACFLTVAGLNPELRRIRWLALCYGTGILTPLAEVLLPLSPSPAPFMILSFGSFLVCLSLMSVALAIYYHARPNWMMAGIIIVSGFMLRWVNWDGPRDELHYELAYQAPFAIACVFAAITIWRASRRTLLDQLLCALFCIIAAQFIGKAFIAGLVGSGPTASDYMSSAYAMFSQVGTGILLSLAGLLLVMNVMQTALSQTCNEALTDSLTGLANRRSLTTEFDAALADALRRQTPLSVIVLDVDHFKQVNDRWGHDIGDRVLRAIGTTLREHSPANARAFRLGGEEFLVLAPGQNLQMARLSGEALRLAIKQMEMPGAPKVTISAGIAEVDAQSETLETALRRADGALYAAKTLGRDRCMVAPQWNVTPDGATPAPHDLRGMPRSA